MMPATKSETFSAIGRCRKCKLPHRAEFTRKSTWSTSGRCWVARLYDAHGPIPYPAVLCCGQTVYLDPIRGSVSDHPCDPRCTNATGRDCECSCGGKNHGAAHALAVRP